MNELTLRWRHGDHAHTRTVAQGERVTIGRSTASDVVMPAGDRRIHREHAEIAWTGRGPVVRAVGRNGVGVRSLGRALRKGEEAPLGREDRLRVGTVEITTQLRTTGAGELKLRCHHCGRVCDYAPHEMCPHCGHALAGGETVIL